MVSGNRLKEARLKKGLSQQALGDLLGVTKVSICGYENGSRTPTMKTFLKLLEILELDTDYALGNDIEVINEKDEPYGVKLAKEDLVIINEFKNYPALYRALVTDPKRTIKLINKKLNK